MAKYSFEFKKKVALAYLNGEGGCEYLSKVYGIPSRENIRKWVHNYQTFGDEGLLRSRKNISIVELYLSSEISYQDLALQEGISNPSMISSWVNRFRAAGPDALRPRKKGRKKRSSHIYRNAKSYIYIGKSVWIDKILIRKLRKKYLRFVKNIKIMEIAEFLESFTIKDIS